MTSGKVLAAFPLVLSLALLSARASAALAEGDGHDADTDNDDATSAEPARSAGPSSPDETMSTDGTTPPGRSILGTYYPPPVDGPELRLPESPSRLTFDVAFAQSKDLSSLPYIAGSGTNFRFALGGVKRWHRFAFEAEIPFLQITSLDVTAVPGGVPDPERQTALSFGDVRLGATWTVPLAGQALVGGFGFRSRLATHSTRFDFFLPTDGSMVSYVFPYYFHLEPTAILGGALGRFIFVINQGLLALTGPNGEFLNMQVVVPNVVFWDSHVAVAYAPFDLLGASLELGTDVQVNHVDDPQFPINHVRSAWLAPAIQIHLPPIRIDLIARIGLGGRGTDTFGVLDYTGTNSYTLRTSWTFN